MPLSPTQVTEFYKRHGYGPKPRSPHLFKTVVVHGYTDPKTGQGMPASYPEYRIVITRIAVRKEAKVVQTGWNGKKETQWVRLRSGYLKDLSIVDDKMHGLKRGGC